MPQHIVYKPAERPECEALVDGRWVPAEVRMWVQHDDGTWTADVGYSPAPFARRPDGNLPPRTGCAHRAALRSGSETVTGLGRPCWASPEQPDQAIAR